MINDTLKQIEETKKEVEQKYQIGGLSDGLYGDYATDVAKSSIIKVLEQLVEREEEMLQKTIEIQNKENSEVWQLSCENAVLAKQDTISYLKSEIANLSTNIDKE